MHLLKLIDDRDEEITNLKDVHFNKEDKFVQVRVRTFEEGVQTLPVRFDKTESSQRSKPKTDP